jgi:hypothetical protein
MMTPADNEQMTGDGNEGGQNPQQQVENTSGDARQAQPPQPAPEPPHEPPPTEQP